MRWVANYGSMPKNLYIHYTFKLTHTIVLNTTKLIAYDPLFHVT